MTITRIRPTFTFDQDRFTALKAIAPDAFADGKINWDVLKEAMGDHLEADGREAEHFGLTWPGKRQARRLARTHAFYATPVFCSRPTCSPRAS